MIVDRLLSKLGLSAKFERSDHTHPRSRPHGPQGRLRSIGLLLNLHGSLVITIPSYLLVAGFDLLEHAFGSADAAYAVLFGIYLIGLGLVAASRRTS